jgi:hypothetical protein
MTPLLKRGKDDDRNSGAEYPSNQNVEDEWEAVDNPNNPRNWKRWFKWATLPRHSREFYRILDYDAELHVRSKHHRRPRRSRYVR